MLMGMEMWTVLAHVILGFIAGLFWWIDWKLSIMITALFLLYECVEETKVQDEMYHEIKEYTTGFVLGVIIKIIMDALIVD